MFNSDNINSFQGNNSTQTEEETELSGRREGITISIRREGRDNQISKRRKQNRTTLKVLQESFQISPFEAKIKEFKKFPFNVNQLPELANCMNDPNLQKLYYGIIGIRRILSAPEEPPIQLVIDAGLIPRIVQLAQQSENEDLKAEATWCLSNITSGTSLQTQSMIECGGIQLFVNLLKSRNDFVVQQSLWAIGNLAADRVLYRDSLMKYGVIDILCRLISQSKNVIIVGQGCWAISNIIRTNPIPSFEKLKPAIKSLAETVAKNRVTDCSIITDILWAFAYVIQQDSIKLTFLMQTGIAPKLIQLLDCGIDQIVSASVRNLGNICYGDENQIQILLSNGILPHFQRLLNSNIKDINKEICWTLSNIAASSAKHVEFLFSHTSLIRKVLNILVEKVKWQVSLEAGFVFVNSCQSGNPLALVQFYHLNGLMGIFIELISSQQNELVEMALKGVNGCLRIGEAVKSQTNGQSIMMQDLLRVEGIDALENIQLHQSTRIYKLSNKILNSYFEINNPLQ